MKKYAIAKQKVEWNYTPTVLETNCTDKVDGHKYEWIYRSNPEHAEIVKQHPTLHKNGGIVKCRKCDKVSSSM